MSDFVHLHLHSEYSLLDGACRTADIPKKAKREGHTAVALTDHGVMYGAVAFYRACRAEGVKPIIGCEVYVAPRSRFDREGKADLSGHHLILLVKNETGYRNLIFLVSAGFTEGFYGKPRIDMAFLREHSEGLIALSACLAGKIPQEILAGDFQGAEKTAREMREIFGDGNFFLEIQDHALTDEKTVAQALRELSEKTGIGLVATNDVHYLEKADAYAQSVLLCIQTGNVLSDGRPFGFETDEFYYKSTAEMKALFADYPGAIENTVRIAEQCNFDFIFGQTHLPTFEPPAGKTHAACLAELVRTGFSARVSRGYIDFSAAPRASYEERIAYELSVIENMGFCAYFLIVQDFVAYAKRAGIPVGPGRGSGAGSLVAYCIGITDVDPIAYDLLFERFLNPERVSLPDFDIDFCYDRRGEVIEYVRRRYGTDHVAQIVTFGTMAARAAVRDVGRALGMPYNEVDAVARLIPHEMNVKIADSLRKKELRAMYDGSEEVRRLLDTAMALEGMPRHASTHAAGLVITEHPTVEYVPLSTNGDTIVTQYDMDTDAALGLVKFDFLGLRYLTVIADAEREIRKTVPDFSIAKVPTDDAPTYRLISAGQTNGVFQLESGGMKQMLTQLRPENMQDIIAAVALYRPGPMDSIPRYIACRHGEQKVSYAVPAMEKILGVTYGCIVYQEQVMQIFRELAGYSYAHADVVRRAMAKKKEKEMQAERALFLKGAAERGVDNATAEGIFDEMAGFASYAFNRSHATAYGLLSYRTAYLKCHYPCAYFAALMTAVWGDNAKLGEYMAECQARGIAVLSPDINESQLHFSVAGDHIRFGLLALKNVGRQFVEQILAEREKGEFRSFEDFAERMAGGDSNRRQVEALIKCGAFDRLGVYRSQLLQVYEQILGAAADRARSNLTGQIDLFSMAGEAAPGAEFSYPDIPEFSVKERLLLEKESTGMYFSGHILDDYDHHTSAIPHESIADILRSYSKESGESDRYRERQSVTLVGVIARRVNKSTRSGESMAFLTLEERMGSMEVLVFPKILAKYDAELCPERAVCARGTLSFREGDDPKLILSEVTPLLDNASYAATEKKPETAAEQAAGPGKRLFVRVPSLDSAVSRLVLSFAAAYPGDTPLVLYDRAEKRYVTAAAHSVAADADFVEVLQKKLGAENVILK